MMPKLSLAALAAACLLFAGQSALFSQESAPTTSAGIELKALVDRVEAKIRDGAHTKGELADELKAFEALWNKYKDQRTEEVGDIIYTRGILLLNFVGDLEQGVAILEEAKKTFPNSRYAGPVEQVIETAKQRAIAQKAKEALVGKAAPEIKFIWSSRGDLDKLGAIKGKVVVLDFWATWCAPCVASFPELKKVTDHYHGYDVEIVGVTSLQGSVAGLGDAPIDCKDDPEKEKKLLGEFMKAKDMNWTVALSKDEVFNPNYMVNSIPHLAIITPDGKIRFNGLSPHGSTFEEKTKMIDALLKEFNLKTPPSS